MLGDLARRETIEQVRCAVLTLPTAYREAVVLCDLGDASYEEAASGAGLSGGDGPVALEPGSGDAGEVGGVAPGGVRGACHV